jgi:hypothetical protein
VPAGLSSVTDIPKRLRRRVSADGRARAADRMVFGAAATGESIGIHSRGRTPMKKSLVSLMLAVFALGSSAVFGQVPEKCKALQGDAQKKCIADEKMKK